MSVLVLEKPLPHISLADWYARQWQNQQTNDTRRDDAFNLRHELRQTRNETRIKSEWNTYHNNVRLADRMTELDRWRDKLNGCLNGVNYALDSLREEKFATEREIDGLGIPLGVISECISSRDCRRGSELTYDESATELKKELCLVENVKSILKEKCQNAWEQMNKLQDIRNQLMQDLNDKTEAYEIDKEQLKLDRNCANITFKSDALRVVRGSVPYETWLDHTKNMKQKTDNELAETFKLREAFFVSRERAKNDMLSQRDRVDFIMRKRIYATQKARNELQWQRLKMLEEMEKIHKEFRTLEEAHAAVTDALKLAETRLENRSYRSGFELCRDDPDKGLKEEVVQLRQTRNNLEDRINCAKATYNALEDQQVVIDHDLSNKEHTLMTDIRCLDLRSRLKIETVTATDRNIMLTKMEKEIPPT